MGSQESFGARVRDRRVALGLTQRQLAEKVARRLRKDDRRGFDVTYLSKIENDRLPPPSTPAVLALAAELGENPDDLLALAGKAPPDVGETLRKSAGARAFFRSASNLDLSEEEWKKLLKRIDEKKP